MAFPGLKDVSPRVRMTERHFVWSNAQNRPILVMKLLDVMDDGATNESIDER